LTNWKNAIICRFVNNPDTMKGNTMTVTNSAPATTTKRIEPQLTEVISGITMPTRTSKRGSVSLYPFASLKVGECFGVKNKTVANLSTIVSNANRKAMEQAKDEKGNPLFETKTIQGQDGSTTEVPDAAKPKMIATKRFFAFEVDAEYAKTIKGTKLEGSTVLVFRDK
jgi:hypothetical protein